MTSDLRTTTCFQNKSSEYVHKILVFDLGFYACLQMQSLLRRYLDSITGPREALLQIPSYFSGHLAMQGLSDQL